MGNLLAVIAHAANIHDTKSGIEPAKPAFKRYPPSKDSALMRDIAVLLSLMWMNFSALVWTFQKKSNRMSGRSSPGAGWLDAPSVG
jgi:hypothetical protein